MAGFIDLSDAQIASLKAPPSLAAMRRRLLVIASNARYAKETGGISVNGLDVPTDRQTQAQLTGAYLNAQANPSASISWKFPDGSFVQLTSSQIIAIAQAVATHVEGCFAAEAAVTAQINATPPMVTTRAQIEAAFA